MKFIAGLIGLIATIAMAPPSPRPPGSGRSCRWTTRTRTRVRLVAIFSPVAFHSTASAFRGGTLDCWYGGGIVDLRDATLDPAGARLEVKAVFGGAQIVVPATGGWRST